MNKFIDLLQSSLHELTVSKENKTQELEILQKRIKDKETEIAQLTLDITICQKAIKMLKDSNE